MAKNSLYKKLVRQFEFSINNYQNVNAELDFAKLEKIILIQKKHNRYYRAIRRFSVYLKEYQDKNKLISISHKSRKKYQHLLEKIELIGNPLEKKKRWSIIAATVKKSIINPLVEISQSLFYMIFFSQLFTKQITTARPLQASRYTRQTNNCECEYTNADQCNETLDMAVYQDDLQKSMDFSEILNRKQSIEFKFKDTIFILTNDCISRRSLNNNPQSLRCSDYDWYLESMAIYLIKKKVRAEAQKQGLSLNEVDVAQITQDICSIDPMQQNNRQLIGIYRHGVLSKINESKLEKFIFNAQYTLNRFQSISPERNNDNLVSRVNNAVYSKIAKRKNLEPEEFNVFTFQSRDHSSRPLSGTQTAISNVLPADINTTSSTSHREGFNWKIIAPVVVGGIGIIVFIVAMIIWYSKKNRLENSGLGTEHIPLLNSIPDKLHVLKIAIHLSKRLESLKYLERYDSEIGNHYISFKDANNKEKAIEDLKKIKEALTKFLEPKKTSNKNKDKFFSNKLESALLIVDSLIQRYNLLSLPNSTTSKNDYITAQLKSGLKDSINSMLDNIEIIRYNFKGNFFSKYNIKKDTDKFKYLDLLLNLEKAIYETMLSAHAEGYFEEYPQELIKNCLNLNTNPNPVVNNEIDLKNIKELQGDLLSTLGFILNPSQTLAKELLKLKEDALYNAIHSFITKLECIKSQLIAYFADYNARWEEGGKLKQTHISIGNVNSTFFGQQPPPPQIIQPTQKHTMH